MLNFGVSRMRDLDRPDPNLSPQIYHTVCAIEVYKSSEVGIVSITLGETRTDPLCSDMTSWSHARGCRCNTFETIYYNTNPILVFNQF